MVRLRSAMGANSRNAGRGGLSPGKFGQSRADRSGSSLPRAFNLLFRYSCQPLGPIPLRRPRRESRSSSTIPSQRRNPHGHHGTRGDWRAGGRCRGGDENGRAIRDFNRAFSMNRVTAACQYRSESTWRPGDTPGLRTLRLCRIATTHFFNWNLNSVPCFLLKSA